MLNIKILKDNYTKFKDESIQDAYPRVIVCEECGSELEYEKSDLTIGCYGLAVLHCPLCGRDNMLDDDENSIILTKDNVEFPKHFWHTSKENGAVDCCNNEEVKKCIHKAIDYFRKNKDDYNWYTEYGNLCINVYRYDGDREYMIIVTDNYYQTYIPFEEEDY